MTETATATYNLEPELDADILSQPAPEIFIYTPSAATGIFYDGRCYYFPKPRKPG